jgi:hypothetical protein
MMTGEPAVVGVPAVPAASIRPLWVTISAPGVFAV